MLPPVMTCGRLVRCMSALILSVIFACPGTLHAAIGKLAELVMVWKRVRSFLRGGWPQQGSMISKLRVLVVVVRCVNRYERLALHAFILVTTCV